MRLKQGRRHWESSNFIGSCFLPSKINDPRSSAGHCVSTRQGGLLRLSPLETLLFSALLFSATLRFLALARQSLWTDELFSVFWAKSGATYALSHAGDETNPPLYYLLLDLWMWVFGESEGAIRLLSACMSALTIVVIYVLGNALFDRRAGIIAALLFALSSWHLYFAQEARVFALLNFAFAVLLLSINGVVVRLQRGSSARSVIGSLPGIGFLLSAVVAAYLHYVAFLMFATIAIALGLIWWRNFAFDRKYCICFSTLGALVALLSTPALALAVRQRHSSSLAWMSVPSVTKFLGLVTGAPAWTGAPDWVLGAVVILSAGTAFIWAAIFVYGSWKHRGQMALFLVYLLPVVGFCVLTVTSVFQPFLYLRTVSWIAIPIYLGLGGAITAFRDKKTRRIAAAVVILASITFTAGYFAFSLKEPWRVRVHNYAARMTSDNLLILDNNTPAIAFVYYHEERLIPQLRRWRSNMTTADKLDEHVTGIRPITDEEITVAVQHGAKLLFVSRGCAVPTMIEQANIDRLFDCNRPLDGWTLILSFMRHILSNLF
jgi:uncharacterized membrane protein